MAGTSTEPAFQHVGFLWPPSHFAISYVFSNSETVRAFMLAVSMLSRRTRLTMSWPLSLFGPMSAMNDGTRTMPLNYFPILVPLRYAVHKVIAVATTKMFLASLCYKCVRGWTDRLINQRRMEQAAAKDSS